jgi:uncharacterized membrane protein
MNAAEAPIYPLYLWLGHTLLVFTLVVCLLRIPWSRFQQSEFLHVFLGASVGLMGLWTIRGGISPGLEFHMLGATTVALMFGWPLAVLSLSLAQLGITLNGEASWHSYSLHVLLKGVLPALLTTGILRLAERILPRHLFVYIFVCAFAGGGMAMAASRLATFIMLVSGETEGVSRLAYESIRYLPLMVLPEALLNGMLITLLVVYRPRWVTTFSDESYLRNR